MESPTNKRACVFQILQTEAESEEPAVPNEVLEKNSGEVEEIVYLAASNLQDSKVKKAEYFVWPNRDVFALKRDPIEIKKEQSFSNS